MFPSIQSAASLSLLNARVLILTVAGFAAHDTTDTSQVTETIECCLLLTAGVNVTRQRQDILSTTTLIACGQTPL